MPGATKFDRILIVAIGALLALFMFGTMSAMVTSASADDATGRNDDAVEIDVVEEDDDADPLARGDSNSGGGGGDDSGGNSRSGNSGSRSIGSHSANTATGTTNN